MMGVATERKLTNPPRMPTLALLLLLGITGGTYAAVQLWIQARWMRRTLNVDASYKWATALLLVTALAVLCLFVSAWIHQTRTPPFGWTQAALNVSGFVLYLGTTSCMTGELGRAPLRLELWEWPSFILGPIYFQYRFNRLLVKENATA
jgi:H+/Cl- antiporter ClcA